LLLEPPGGWRLRLSRHAVERMRERGVSVEEVLGALREPVQLLYDTRRDVYLALSAEGVGVVYAARGRVVEVVTVLRRREYEALVGRLGPRRYRVIM